MSSLLFSFVSFTLVIHGQQEYLYGCGYGSTESDPVLIHHLLDLTLGMGATATGAGTVLHKNWLYSIIHD